MEPTYRERCYALATAKGLNLKAPKPWTIGNNYDYTGYYIKDGNGRCIASNLDCDQAEMLLELSHAAPVEKRRIAITRLPLNKQNRMLRVGFGLHDGCWFFRVDLWFCGWRIKHAP